MTGRTSRFSKGRLAEASKDSEREVLSGLLAPELRMTDKFDPAPFDKHAADPKEATKTDLLVDEQLEAGLVGGSFPASDPPSATQPSPSKYDEGTA
ncbi:hypothetical protein [Bradyrhizobium sp.]|uniref:hypothetical protein n=1 Tax=Bradyrhizobium sp. TaxID=376 RepID=UPI003C28A1DE